MARSAVMNFMKQQGFTQEPPDRATLRFKGLQFQPTIVGAMMLVAIVTQSPAIFLLVSALLWLNVLLPAANPFEQVYNRFVARRRGRPPLTPAPGPRRRREWRSPAPPRDKAVVDLLERVCRRQEYVEPQQGRNEQEDRRRLREDRHQHHRSHDRGLELQALEPEGRSIGRLLREPLLLHEIHHG